MSTCAHFAVCLFLLAFAFLTWAIPCSCPTPDFFLAQFAIIGKGNVKKAVKRVQNYQKHIVVGYGYSTEAAMPSLGFMNRKWPTMMFPAAPDKGGRACFVMNVGPYIPSELKGESEWREMVHDFLLCFDACNSDLDEVRRGSVMMMEAREMGWKNFNMELERRASVLYQDAYPARFHQFPVLGAQGLLSAMLKLCRFFLVRAGPCLAARAAGPQPACLGWLHQLCGAPSPCRTNQSLIRFERSAQPRRSH